MINSHTKFREHYTTVKILPLSKLTVTGDEYNMIEGNQGVILAYYIYIIGHEICSSTSHL